MLLYDVTRDVAEVGGICIMYVYCLLYIYSFKWRLNARSVRRNRRTPTGIRLEGFCSAENTFDPTRLLYAKRRQINGMRENERDRESARENDRERKKERDEEGNKRKEKRSREKSKREKESE